MPMKVDAETLCPKHFNEARDKGRELTVKRIVQDGFCTQCGENRKRVFELSEIIKTGSEEVEG